MTALPPGVLQQCQKCGVRDRTVHFEPKHLGLHLIPHRRRARVSPRRGFLCNGCCSPKKRG